MADKLSDVRKSLKTNVKTEGQARKLAQTAASVLAPGAANTVKLLDDAFRAIPIAKQYRGETDAARKAAMQALDEAEQKSQKGSNHRRAVRPEPG